MFFSKRCRLAQNHAHSLLVTHLVKRLVHLQYGTDENVNHH